MGRAKVKGGKVFARLPGETTVEYALRIARAKANTRDKSEPIVPIEAEQHGRYVAATILDPSGETRNSARTLVNRGGTPICRWESAGKLTATQLAVIALCQRLWRLAGLNQRVTATYAERAGGMGSAELAATNEIEAREDLHRMQSYVPRDYWNVWENVVRHSIPAGVASGLGYEGKEAQHRTHTIVCFVADIIAMREGI